MSTCPNCGYAENALKWFKKGDNYFADSRHEGLKYKIEKENNVMWFYNIGAKTHRNKLPVVFNVFICQDNEKSNGMGFTTLLDAKVYCQNYEN